MSAILTESDLRAINQSIQGIRTSALNDDASVLAVLTPLGFSDMPSEWETQAEEVFDRLIGAAIRSTVDELQRLGNRIRVQHVSEVMVDRTAVLTHKAVECELVLAELNDTVLSHSSLLDPQCCRVLQNYLPEVHEGIASFRLAISYVRALLDEKIPVFSFLEQHAYALRDALQVLDDGPPETVLLCGAAVVETLASMWDERQAIVAEANALVSGLMRHPQDLHGAKRDLDAMARRLQSQGPQHESYVNTLTIFINCIDDELPVLHFSDQEITVRDLFNAPAEQRLLDTAFATMFNYGDTLQRVLFLITTVLELAIERR